MQTLYCLPTFMTFSISKVWLGVFKISLPIAVSSFNEFPAPFTNMLLFEYLRARMHPLSSILSFTPCVWKEFNLVYFIEMQTYLIGF